MAAGHLPPERQVLMEAVLESLHLTHAYWRATLHFLAGGAYDGDAIKSLPVAARAHCFGRALHVVLWGTKHYRCDSWQTDLRNNLRNVALPGTLVPLSVVCSSKAAATAFLLVGVPAYSLVAAVWQAKGPWRDRGLSALELYRRHLMAPRDWFSIWRLNCALAALHAHITADAGYELEDKWAFLRAASAHGIPVSAWWDAATDIVVKHRNVEGGQGIHSFRSCHAGGDYIIQAKLENAAPLRAMLPKGAPLSTLRVVSASHLSLPEGSLLSQSAAAGRRAADEGAAADGRGSGGIEGAASSLGSSDVEIVACVWRAGRAGEEGSDCGRGLFGSRGE
jgi:hypothetical protein